MTSGKVLTAVEFDKSYIIPVYRAANNVIPDIAFHITSAQFRLTNKAWSGYNTVYPSKYGTQYFGADVEDFLLNDLYDKIDKAIGGVV